MRAIAFCIPGDIETPTGGYRYDREVLRQLTAQGLAVRHVGLPGGFPLPTEADLDRTFAALAAEPADDLLLLDGLALGALPPERIAPFGDRLVALVHHPLGLEAGLSPDRAAFLIANERSVLAQVAHVIVTSRTTAATLAADFGVPAARITVAEPGVHRPSPSTRLRDPAHLLAVGSVTPRKGYDVLLDALVALPVAPVWRLTIVGALDRGGETFAALMRQTLRLGLADRVSFVGPQDEDQLAALYAEVGVFVMSSHYEGYGMVIAEALAAGLPIVSTTGGALAETVPDGAALKVPPGDAAALGNALRAVLENPALRLRLAAGAKRAASVLPTWDATAATIAAALQSLAGRKGLSA